MTKRTILAVLGALALTLGLVGGPAAAGDSYPGTVQTKVILKGPNSVKVGKQVQISVSVKTRGTGQPEGRVTLEVAGPRGYQDAARKRYDGRVFFQIGPFKKPGTYKVTVTFDGGDSVYRDARASDSFTVTKKKK